jgi:hypothetical protein
MSRDAETKVITASFVSMRESVKEYFSDVKRINTRIRSNNKTKILEDEGNRRRNNVAPMTW